MGLDVDPRLIDGKQFQARKDLQFRFAILDLPTRPKGSYEGSVFIDVIVLLDPAMEKSVHAHSVQCLLTKTGLHIGHSD
jgi:hypothetical protein